MHEILNNNEENRGEHLTLLLRHLQLRNDLEFLQFSHKINTHMSLYSVVRFVYLFISFSVTNERRIVGLRIECVESVAYLGITVSYL
jgi:hypothetical protein